MEPIFPKPQTITAKGRFQADLLHSFFLKDAQREGKDIFCRVHPELVPVNWLPVPREEPIGNTVGVTGFKDFRALKAFLKPLIDNEALVRWPALKTVKDARTLSHDIIKTVEEFLTAEELVIIRNGYSVGRAQWQPVAFRFTRLISYARGSGVTEDDSVQETLTFEVRSIDPENINELTKAYKAMKESNPFLPASYVKQLNKLNEGKSKK